MHILFIKSVTHVQVDFLPPTLPSAEIYTMVRLFCVQSLDQSTLVNVLSVNNVLSTPQRSSFSLRVFIRMKSFRVAERMKTLRLKDERWGVPS